MTKAEKYQRVINRLFALLPTFIMSTCFLVSEELIVNLLSILSIVLHLVCMLAMWSILRDGEKENERIMEQLKKLREKESLSQWKK